MDRRGIFPTHDVPPDIQIVLPPNQRPSSLIPVDHDPFANVPENYSVFNPIDENSALRSKVVPGYNAPIKPPRPFEADYPAGAASDERGNLATDIEGRPLGARYVAGRRVLGGPDEALSPAELVSLGTESLGAKFVPNAPNQLGGAAGRLVRERDPGTGLVNWEIQLSNKLTPGQLDRTAAHETGHLIDEVAGQIPTQGLSRELSQIYNTLNTGRERTTNLTGPQHLGYSAAEVPREQMAEAIRAYLTDPNYLKTVAPKTAAAIRGAVNDHPTLSRAIQFNASGLPIFVTPVDHDPFEAPQ